MAHYYSDPVIKNSIIWGNDDSYGDDDIDAYNNSVVTVTYSAFEYYYEDGTSDITWSSCVYTDPLFADAGNNDFHLKSAGGRWNGSEWVQDNAVSPCINTGDPSSGYSNEPTPNGSRINMGFYGNTSEASKTGYGSLKVDLDPSTAQWSVSSSPDTWRDSGETVSGILAYGDKYPYGIYFKEHPGYKTPDPMGGVFIYPEETTYKFQKYEPE